MCTTHASCPDWLLDWQASLNKCSGCFDIASPFILFLFLYFYLPPCSIEEQANVSTTNRICLRLPDNRQQWDPWIWIRADGWIHNLMHCQPKLKWCAHAVLSCSPCRFWPRDTTITAKCSISIEQLLSGQQGDAYHHDKWHVIMQMSRSILFVVARKIKPTTNGEKFTEESQLLKDITTKNTSSWEKGPAIYIGDDLCWH